MNWRQERQAEQSNKMCMRAMFAPNTHKYARHSGSHEHYCGIGFGMFCRTQFFLIFFRYLFIIIVSYLGSLCQFAYDILAKCIVVFLMAICDSWCVCVCGLDWLVICLDLCRALFIDSKLLFSR